MRIRSARTQEAEALARLAWDAKASWGYSTLQLHAWREGLRPSAVSIAERPTFVAEVGERLLWFCQLNPDATPIELEHLWVHPDVMGQGVGRALLHRCLAHLATTGLQELHIDSDPNAEPFYLACGAVRVGEVSAPIDGQPDRVRPQMRISLERPNPSFQ